MIRLLIRKTSKLHTKPLNDIKLKNDIESIIKSLKKTTKLNPAGYKPTAQDKINRKNKFLVKKQIAKNEVQQMLKDDEAQPPIPFINEKSTFSDHFKNKNLLSKIDKMGLKKLTYIQERTFNAIEKEPSKTTIIASETGSGKTLAFLLPIIEDLLDSKPNFGKIVTKEGSLAVDEKEPTKKGRLPRSIILAPTHELCKQIRNVLKSLLLNLNVTFKYIEKGKDFVQLKNETLCEHKKTLKERIQSTNENEPSLLNALRETSEEKQNKLEFSEDKNSADIIVCTPQTLSKNMTEDIALNLRHFVIDEADELIVSNKENWNILKKIFNVFVQVRKEICHAPETSPLKLQYQTKTNFVFCGATFGKKMIKNFLHKQRLTKKQENRLNPTHKLFDGATWVESPYLHYVLPQIEADWIEVRGQEDHEYALLQSLGLEIEDFSKNKELENYNDIAIKEKVKELDIKPTIIFCGIRQNVMKINRLLKTKGFNVVSVHEKMANDVRGGNLTNFCNGKYDILVCTDILSRGIDFKKIDHVIQYDFSKNVTEYLHRVGRTGRAGQHGKVTNFYVPRNEPLVRAIRQGSNDLSDDFRWKKNKKAHKKIIKAEKEQNIQSNNKKQKEMKDKTWWRKLGI